MAPSWVCGCVTPSVRDAHHIEDPATSGASFSALLETAAKAGGPCIISCEAPAFEAAVDAHPEPFAAVAEVASEATEPNPAEVVSVEAVMSATAAVIAETDLQPMEEGAADVVADAGNDASEQQQTQQQQQWGPCIKQQPATLAAAAAVAPPPHGDEREQQEPDQQPRAPSPTGSASEQQLLAATAHPPTGVVGARWRTSEVVPMSPSAVSARKLAAAAPRAISGGDGKPAARELTSVRSFRLTDCAMDDAE